MNSDPQIQTSELLEWDTPWNFWLLTAGVCIVGLWILWQIIRECRIAGSRWGMLFVLLRGIVASILLWMLMGPTSVVVREETRPRTLAVYLDTSSSMTLSDPPDLLADVIWNEPTADLASAAPQSGGLKSGTAGSPGDEHGLLVQVRSALQAASRAALFADASCQEAERLLQLIRYQARQEERVRSAARWCELIETANEWLQQSETPSPVLENKQSAAQSSLPDNRVRSIGQELLSMMTETTWLAGDDFADQIERLAQLKERCDEFSARCHILVEDVSQNAKARFATEDHWMNTSVRSSDTRLGRVVSVLSTSIGRWEGNNDGRFRIRLSQFDENVSELPERDWDTAVRNTIAAGQSEGTVRQTDLGELLKQIRNESGQSDIAAAVVLSDGRQTIRNTIDPRELASQLRIPLCVVPIGRSELAKDVVLHHIQAPSMVVEKDRILIEGLVTASLFSGATCEIQLLEGQSVLESRILNLTHDQEDQRFHFEVPTVHPGRREFTLRAVELPGEHTADNNTATVAVDVTEASVRILIADSRARWEYQYLINLFRRQKQIEFDQLHFQPELFGTGHREQDPKLPQTADEWSAYRLVILGDISPDHLADAAQESLREYLVQRGGNLIVIAGQNSMPHGFGGGPLLDLLPVESVPNFQPDKSGYRVELTPEGRSVDAMRLDEDTVTTEAVWREMSDVLPVYAISGFHKSKPASEVLLSAASRSGGSVADAAAFLTWHRTGAGRVAFLSSPSTWQLRMRNGDKYHHRFWGQLIRWMLAGSSTKGSRYVRLGSDRLKYEQSDVAQFSLDLTDPQGRPVSNAAPEIQIFSAGQLLSRLELRPDEKIPGRYQGRFAAEKSGRYQARATGADVDRLLTAENYQEPVQAEITFEPPISPELTDSRSDLPLLETLARQSGGMVIHPAALSELSRALSLEPAVSRSSQRTPIWDRWWCLWIIIGCFTAEWLIRKKTGLA